MQEFWPFSLRAESDVRIAWLEASVFKEAGLRGMWGYVGESECTRRLRFLAPQVSMDLSGHAAARRRVLEAACRLSCCQVVKSPDIAPTLKIFKSIQPCLPRMVLAQSYTVYYRPRRAGCWARQACGFSLGSLRGNRV